jgi:uncharacterized oxidoreductase
MRMSGNTILIAGGSSGIGRALALAFHSLGNKVIVAGRRRHLLDELVAGRPGMESAALDVRDPDAIRRLAIWLREAHTDLNVVIENAGIMRREDLKAGALEDAEAIVATNLLGPIRLTAALLPLLLQQPRAAILTISSGLAFVPMVATPTYCATKAAIHSYTQSLRYQLRDTAIQVIEIIPPWVQTDLLDAGQAKNPRAMPLDEFIAETMSILTNSPEETEIWVERVKRLRYAERSGDYAGILAGLNEGAAAAERNRR